jgi:RNA polymerase sigma factor (sigma-70 family)
LRLRSDEQLVALFREGHDEAFRVIHDRYRQRLFAYTRQMLPGSRQDAEDALQDVFVRAYSGLRANDRELTLRAWLYRVAHNRCVDELRRPAPPAPELLDTLHAPSRDPVLEAERRDSLRRLVEDVRRLPDQQRSALLMRELGGMPYNDIAGALGVSVAAVKSLLVRARIGLAQAAEARDTACCDIREELIVAHDKGVRPSGLARRHMHECTSCRAFRSQMRGVSRQLAGLVAPIGPAGMLAHLLGLGGGGGAAAASGGAGAGAASAAGAGAGAAAIGGGAATAGAGFVAVGHVATLLAAAVVTAGGAVELQSTLSAPPRHAHAARHAAAAAPAATSTAEPAATAAAQSASSSSTDPTAAARPARTAVTRSHSHKTSVTKPATSKSAVGLVKQLTSSVSESVPPTGGGGLGDGTDGTADGGSSMPTDAGAPTTGSDTTPSTDGTTTGTDPTDGSTGTASGQPGTTSVPPASVTSDPNATTASAGGSAGSPPVTGSTGTDSSTGSTSSGSGSSGSNWSL